MSASNTKAVGQKEIKEVLTTRYGITDFSDCLEVSDLQAKLAQVQESRPVTYGLRYGQLLEIGNKKNPTGLVTLSHGLGDSCFGWQDVGEELASRFPYLLFLLPTAPHRAVTVNGGQSMPAWYDIRAMISTGLRGGPQDALGVSQSAEYLTSLAATTCKKLAIPPNRVFFCGFSQGAAVSLAAGLLGAAHPPAGVALMSGYLPAAGEVMEKHAALIAENASFRERFTVPEKAMKFAIFHGRQDTIVPMGAAKDTKTLLEKEVLQHMTGDAATVAFHEYNMQHSAVPQEIDELARFLEKVLPEAFNKGL